MEGGIPLGDAAGIGEVPGDGLFVHGPAKAVGRGGGEDGGLPVVPGHGIDWGAGAIIGDDFGILKLLFDPDTRKVLGVHIFGSQASELLHIGQAVMQLGGTIDYFVETIFNYPTFAEAYKVAGLNGGEQAAAVGRGGLSGEPAC